MSCSSAQQDASEQQDSVVKGGGSSAGHSWAVEGDEIGGEDVFGWKLRVIIILKEQIFVKITVNLFLIYVHFFGTEG